MKKNKKKTTTVQVFLLFLLSVSCQAKKNSIAQKKKNKNGQDSQNGRSSRDFFLEKKNQYSCCIFWTWSVQLIMLLIKLKPRLTILISKLVERDRQSRRRTAFIRTLDSYIQYPKPLLLDRYNLKKKKSLPVLTILK